MMNPEKLGVKLAQELRWGVEDIGAAIVAALVESNCHELAKSFEKLLNNETREGRP
jgi:hypothetical protein